MAKITVKLFASLTKFKPAHAENSSFEMSVKPGDTVKQLVIDLGMPPEKVKVISVNQKIVKSDCQLSDGDLVNLFPTIAAG